MDELVVVYLNGHEVWLKIDGFYDDISERYWLDDSEVLVGYDNGVPKYEFTPAWLANMLNNELYDDVMEQLNGEDLTI